MTEPFSDNVIDHPDDAAMPVHQDADISGDPIPEDLSTDVPVDNPDDSEPNQ